MHFKKMVLIHFWPIVHHIQYDIRDGDVITEWTYSIGPIPFNPYIWMNLKFYNSNTADVFKFFFNR